MKRTDIAMIVLIASIGIVVAFFVTQAILGSPSDETVNVKTIDAISSDVEEPDEAIFNANAINPTWGIRIGSEASEATAPTTGE